ncbi:MAG: hypothetical protein LBU85_13155 [Treponema sp.]|jgi:hypothetical protein|nr:hypothetical protein [Treponema sp.]
MKIELCKDGYEKIEERIQAIENFANEGVFAYPLKTAPEKCQQIVFETKKLRQVLRDVLYLVPDTVQVGEGDAA